MDRHHGTDGWRSAVAAHVLWLYWFLWFGGGCALLGALAEVGYARTDWETFWTLGLSGGAMIGLALLWHRVSDPMG